VNDDDYRDEAWDDDKTTRLVRSPREPYPNAQTFLVEFYPGAPQPHLVHQGGSFYEWVGPYWAEVEDDALRAELYKYFDAAEYEDANGDLRPFNPTRHKVADRLDALAKLTHLARAVQTPAWLDPTAAVVASEYVSCRNGLLHVPHRRMQPHTPLMYLHHAVPFDYLPRAPKPKRWLSFLAELWPDDAEAILALQQMFGYILSGETRQQKMFMIVGPRRSGKGTIARVLKALLGQHHVAGSTLSSLATNFGLQPLINKALTVVSDARITEGHSVVIERLLSITGEDLLTVDRKYRDPWTGTLPTRILILSNELPRLVDSSGALAGRFIILLTRTSFYGRENIRLTDELFEELPGILNWTLDGIKALTASGRLLQPKSSADAIREMEDLTSPVGAFIRDWCTVGAENAVRCEVLYHGWRAWCADHGRDRPGTTQTFGRDLRAALAGLRVTQPRDDDGASRVRMYQGIDLRQEYIDRARVPTRAEPANVPPPARDGTRSLPLYPHPDEPLVPPRGAP
jgi:putative DNA primase/helicase